MKTLFTNKLIKVVTWLATSFTFKTGGSIPLSLVIDLIHRLDKVVKSRGPEEGLHFVKSLRSAVLNYLSGDVKPVGINLTKDGVPTFLCGLIPYFRRSQYLVIAIVNTILWSTRSLKIGKAPDISPIKEQGLKTLPDNLMIFRILLT